jgi:hypothetical protein
MAYAWTNLLTYDENGKMNKIPPGDEVTAADLSITDEEFAELEFIGAVREQDYPVPEGYDGSPVEYAKEQLFNMAQEGEGFFPPLEVAQLPAYQEAMDKIGYDPEKGPEEQSLKDTVDEDAEEVAAATTEASASAVKPPTQPASTSAGPTGSLS